jgi:hypothetical protein
MTMALLLLSFLEVETPVLTTAGYMLLLGCGLGMVMQILVMAVQNSVPYEMLGAATSGTTLFRSIGGSVGTSIFGGLFAFVLQSTARQALPSAPAGILDPAAIAALEGPVRSAYLALFVDALHPVFRMASVLAFPCFLLSLALQEKPLRKSIAPDTASDALQLPRDATSLAELKRIAMRMLAKENRWRVYQRVAAECDIELEPDELWLLARVSEGDGRETSAGLVRRLSIGKRHLLVLLAKLEASRVLEWGWREAIQLTGRGRDMLDRLVRMREANLKRMLDDWNSNEQPEVRSKVASLARSFAAAPPERPR